MSTLYSLGAVTVAGYRLHTGDETTDGVTVTGALVEAEETLGEELRRKLALMARTASFYIYPDGRIYPDAWPIQTSTFAIEGRALLGATPDVTTFIGYFPNDPPRLATITWTGGYDDGTQASGAHKLPTTLRHAVYELARAFATDASPVPVGAVSMSIGDASVTFGAPSSGGLDALVPGLWDRVKRFRNRWV